MPESQLFAEGLCAFIGAASTAFHASGELKKQFLERGYQELQEQDAWELRPGSGYFVERNGSLISFVLGEDEGLEDGFRMLGAHTDSPCFQIKPSGQSRDERYYKLAVEIYGGPLLTTWFDRELSIAGRVFIKCADGSFHSLLIDFARPILCLPSLAIHLDHDANTNKSVQKQKELQPILGDLINSALPHFDKILLEQVMQQYPELGVEKILSFDLFCYCYATPKPIGLNHDYIMGPRIDNQLSCYCGMRAQLAAGFKRNSLLMCFNHEENGSTSMSGGNSNFLETVLERICGKGEILKRCLVSSFVISMDNAHATHPNHPDKADSDHYILMNKGPVLKINANQRYATNGRGIAIFKALCDEAEITCQEFVMRNDMPCGSTIGPMVSSNLGVCTVDVGAASLGMHSACETTGAKDPYLLFQAASCFLNSHIHHKIL